MINAVETNNNLNYYLRNEQKRAEPSTTFIVENKENKEKQNADVPEQFAEASFWNLMNSSDIIKKQIPKVNQIVSSKNVEDGEIYLTFFSDEKITCTDAIGKRVWEIEVENTKQENKINAFFSNLTPNRDFVQEYYSGDDLGMVSSKNFWLKLFMEP